MSSLAVRDFSFFRSRMLSATNLTVKKKLDRLSTEENLSEPRPLNTQQQHHASEAYEVLDFGVANDQELVSSHFNQDYLQSRSNVLAYGKQMTRVEETSGEIPPNERPRKIESRSSKIFRRNSSKKSLRQGSWLSRVRRSPSRNSAGSLRNM